MEVTGSGPRSLSRKGCDVGALTYGTGLLRVEIDDDLLAHLQLVVTAKLRRHEGFMLTITAYDTQLHSSIWLNDSIPLVFEYASIARPAIDRELVDSMMIDAVTSGGLCVDASPAERKELSIVQ